MPYRYVNPDAGRMTKFATSVITFEDYLGGAVLSVASVVGAVFGIAFAIANNFLFLLLLLPGIITLILASLMVRGSFNREVYPDKVLEEANRLYDKTKGEYVESLALPILKKIYEHSQDSEETYHNYGDCKSCHKRVTVLKELVPAIKTASDESDIQAARDFINARKEIGL